MGESDRLLAVAVLLSGCGGGSSSSKPSLDDSDYVEENQSTTMEEANSTAPETAEESNSTNNVEEQDNGATDQNSTDQEEHEADEENSTEPSPEEDQNSSEASNDENSSDTPPIIIDTTPPVITLNGAESMGITQHSSYQELNATAVDNEDGNLSSAIIISGVVDTSKVGVYTVTYSVQDSAGNSATIERTITVVLPPDTTAPVITLNGESNMTIRVGDTYTEPGATAMDDRDGNLTVTIEGDVNNSVANVYTLVYTAVDSAGNPASKTRTVTVEAIVPSLADTNISVEENTTGGTVLGVLNSVIEGSSPITSITLSGTGSSNFEVDTAGNITLKSGVSLDYETTSSYTLTAIATSSVGQSDPVQVVVQVLDVYESLAPLAKSEPYYKYSWHLNSENSPLSASGYSIDDAADIGIEEAWAMSMGEGVVVAVIDDGADLDHEDLQANIQNSYNSVTKENAAQYVPSEEYPASHGNTCAGFIAAPINGKGIVGTAPKSKVVIINGIYHQDTTDATTIHAFEYAKSQGAKVISCSWGSNNISDAMRAELKSLYEANITVLFASGNYGQNLDQAGVNDESEVEWVIGVGASGENNDVTSYSNYGSTIEVIAPGGDTETSSGILGLRDMGAEGDSTIQRGLVNTNYGFTNGTSFSTPVAAGVVALMYAVNPAITPAQVRTILIETADKVGTDTGANYNIQGFDTRRAYGKINAAKAVAEAKRLGEG